MARRQLAGQYGQTLDATALVHEAYLKLIGRREAQFDDRAHFFAYAASAMRSVVVDYARQRLAQKRGGDLHRVTDLPEDIEGGLRIDEDMLALDVALTRLAAVDAKLGQVVELRYKDKLIDMQARPRDLAALTNAPKPSFAAPDNDVPPDGLDRDPLPTGLNPGNLLLPVKPAP